MTIWRLGRGVEKKFRAGHPWVFSNELAHSPKGVEPGALVELRDSNDGFLARGYGHPNSLISFRTLTREKETPIDALWFSRRLQKASSLRKLAGVDSFSHRLCFAEGDHLPGLIIDRYRVQGNDRENAQVFVVQSSTAGMDRLLSDVFSALEILVQSESEADDEVPTWESTSIVLANDSKSRALEGVPIEPKRLVKTASEFNAEAALAYMQPGRPDLSPTLFEIDLIGGQKTGFFLDQRVNVQMTSGLVDELVKARRRLRILDICCYVGQWGTQLAHQITSRGGRAHVTLVDASAKALSVASRNVEANGGEAHVEKMDVLEDLKNLDPRAYDIVICDPPAFIKKKKDLITGTQAYFKLNREALRRVSGGGIFVSCSCSGLFSEEDFRAMLSRVTGAHDRETRWLLRGGHSPDHPQRPEFPQGTYLKSWIGTVME